MEKSPGKLDETFLKALEQVWGFKLPTDYRNFLLEHNGGYPEKPVFDFKNDSEDGSVLSMFFCIYPDFNHNLLDNLKIYQHRIPSHMFPIADDDCGNLILLSVKNPDRGKIYFWDHEMECEEGEEPDYSNLSLIADSFEEFCDKLREKELPEE